MTASGKRLPGWLPSAAIAVFVAVVVIYLLLALLGNDLGDRRAPFR